MTNKIVTSLVITACPLSEDTMKSLVAKNLVLARITSESPSFVMDLMDIGNWENGTGLLSSFTDPTVKSPEEAVCKIIDKFGLTSVEDLNEQSSTEEQGESQKLWISKVEIYGAGASPKIQERLSQAGFGSIENQDYGCSAIRAS